MPNLQFGSTSNPTADPVSYEWYYSTTPYFNSNNQGIFFSSNSTTNLTWTRFFWKNDRSRSIYIRLVITLSYGSALSTSTTVELCPIHPDEDVIFKPERVSSGGTSNPLSPDISSSITYNDASISVTTTYGRVLYRFNSKQELQDAFHSGSLNSSKGQLLLFSSKSSSSGLISTTSILLR